MTHSFYKASCETDVYVFKYHTLFYNKLIFLSKYLLCSPFSYGTSLHRGGGFQAMVGWTSCWELALLMHLEQNTPSTSQCGDQGDPVLVAKRTSLESGPVWVLTRTHKLREFFLLTLPLSAFSLLPHIALTCKVKS